MQSSAFIVMLSIDLTFTPYYLLESSQVLCAFIVCSSKQLKWKKDDCECEFTLKCLEKPEMSIGRSVPQIIYPRSPFPLPNHYIVLLIL